MEFYRAYCLPFALGISHDVLRFLLHPWLETATLRATYLRKDIEDIERMLKLARRAVASNKKLLESSEALVSLEKETRQTKRIPLGP